MFNHRHFHSGDYKVFIFFCFSVMLLVTNMLTLACNHSPDATPLLKMYSASGFLILSLTHIIHIGHKTLRHQDTSDPHETLQHRLKTLLRQNVVRNTSASDRRKVGTLWTQDNSDKTQLHWWFRLKLVPKCLGAEMSLAEVSGNHPHYSKSLFFVLCTIFCMHVIVYWVQH